VSIPKNNLVKNYFFGKKAAQKKKMIKSKQLKKIYGIVDIS